MPYTFFFFSLLLLCSACQKSSCEQELNAILEQVPELEVSSEPYTIEALLQKQSLALSQEAYRCLASGLSKESLVLAKVYSADKNPALLIYNPLPYAGYNLQLLSYRKEGAELRDNALLAYRAGKRKQLFSMRYDGIVPVFEFSIEQENGQVEALYKGVYLKADASIGPWADS